MLSLRPNFLSLSAIKEKIPAPTHRQIPSPIQQPPDGVVIRTRLRSTLRPAAPAALVLEAPSVASGPKDLPVPPLRLGVRTHIVQKGETLGSIISAELPDLSLTEYKRYVVTVCLINEIHPDVLSSGQELKLPWIDPNSKRDQIQDAYEAHATFWTRQLSETLQGETPSTNLMQWWDVTFRFVDDTGATYCAPMSIADYWTLQDFFAAAAEHHGLSLRQVQILCWVAALNMPPQDGGPDADPNLQLALALAYDLAYADLVEESGKPTFVDGLTLRQPQDGNDLNIRDALFAPKDLYPYPEFKDQ